MERTRLQEPGLIATLRSLRRYRRSYRNWIEVLGGMRSRAKFPLTGRVRDGRVVQLGNRRWARFYTMPGFETAGEDISFLWRKRRITLRGGATQGDPFNIFDDDAYGPLPVDHRDVVDLGCSNGDSAVYFLLKGAKRVIAVDSDPHAGRLVEENVAANGVASGACQFVAATIGPATGLADLVRQFDIGPGASLKCDIDGGEQQLLTEATPELLRTFHDILVEYENEWAVVEESLRRAGFLVKVGRPFHLDGPPGGRVGFLWARLP